MRNKRFRPTLESLEARQLLTANLWFVDSGQSLGTNTDGAQFGDLDGDGDQDIIVGCRAWPGGDQCTETAVWLNDGSGQFSKGWSVEETNVGRFALGDLDGDGDLDAYVAKASPSAPDNPPFGQRDLDSQVWLNDGQGNFENSGQHLDDRAYKVTLADVDGDSDLDAIAAYPIGASRVWLNNGVGEFTDSGQRLAPAQWTIDIAMGDVDGDGDLDAYFARGLDSPTDLLYLNDGQGNFTDSGQKLDPNYTLGVRLEDLDGDGDLDAFTANGHEVDGINQPNRVYFNDGTGKFVDSGQRIGLAISSSVQLEDLDGDGDLDAFVANGVRHFGKVLEQPNEIWLNDGSGVFTLGQQIGDAASYRVALADIDNDGDIDAFFGNIGQNNQIWINTQAVPITGTIEAIENNNAVPPTLFVDASGSGNASVLGPFTVAYQFEVELATLTGSGQAQFVTANGDSLFADVNGQATPTEDPDVVSIVETFTVAGGTERFAGATGSFIVERSLNRVTGFTSGSFDGNILFALAGDVDGDGEVQFADFLILSNNFGHTDAARGDGDLNGDHVVNFADFLILSSNYGQARPSPAALTLTSNLSPNTAPQSASAEVSATDEVFESFGKLK